MHMTAAFSAFRRNGLAFLPLLALLFAPHAWAVTTYTFTGKPYKYVTPYLDSCSEFCADYTKEMTMSGWFTTDEPLASNLAGEDIRSLITGFSFSDGINTYADDQDVVVPTFSVRTDADGNVAFAQIALQRWLQGTAEAHVSGQRLSTMSIDHDPDAPPMPDLAFNNIGCDTTDGSTCTDIALDGLSSSGQTSDAGQWVTTADSGGGDDNSSSGGGALAPLWLALLAVGVITRRGQHS